MDPETYVMAASVEDGHWWFKGRRAILRSLLANSLTPMPAARSILEIGCGNGGNFPLLREYGEVTALELNDNAIRCATERGLARVIKGWLPDGVPDDLSIFDLVLALDVLEHVDDDLAAVGTLRDLVAPDGLLVLTVPAYQWLWSPHDELNHHKRRYTQSKLAELLAKQGLRICNATYFNSILLPLAVPHILYQRYFGNDPYSALRIPRPAINYVLEFVFQLEARLIPHIALPFGTSILVAARSRQYPSDERVAK